MSEAVVLDFAGLHAGLQREAKHYLDLSAEGDFLLAIHNVYDALRWAETKQDASFVLITDIAFFKEQLAREERSDQEHLDALYDRLFRAASGKTA